MYRVGLLVLFAAAALGGCATAPAPATHGVTEAGAQGDDALRMTYLGTGGWILEHRGEQVLTGPLFTNPSVLAAGFSDIASDTILVDRYMAPYDVSGARVILVGHAHYDHLMDVPRVAIRHAPEARILGSRTVLNTLGTWSGLAGRADLAEGAAGDEEAVGRWIPYGPRVRVMPLRSMHGPHFAGLTLYRGTMDAPLARPPRRATEWPDGETFAFLVDFLDSEGAVAFRVYYQDAGSPPPLGFAPSALIAERPVDVAVLVPATFEEVPWHPEGIVRNLRPRRIVLGHWEDFFQPIEREEEPVPLTDFSEFARRLARVFDGDVWLPARFAEIRLAPGSARVP